jgi:hypothetical protein
MLNIRAAPYFAWKHSLICTAPQLTVHDARRRAKFDAWPLLGDMWEMNMSTQRENDRLHARRALEDAFARQNAVSPCVSMAGDGFSFCRDPAQYEWGYVGKRDMLVPYNCALFDAVTDRKAARSPLPAMDSIRWEMHQVWIVEGTLYRGESNILQRRRFYIDVDSWLVLLGEGYDLSGQLVMYYVLDSYTNPSKLADGFWYDI